MRRRTIKEKIIFDEFLLQDEDTSEKGKKYIIIRLMKNIRIFQEFGEED